MVRTAAVDDRPWQGLQEVAGTGRSGLAWRTRNVAVVVAHDVVGRAPICGGIKQAKAVICVLLLHCHGACVNGRRVRHGVLPTPSDSCRIKSWVDPGLFTLIPPCVRSGFP